MSLSFIKNCLSSFAGMFHHNCGCRDNQHNDEVNLQSSNDPLTKVMTALREQYEAKALRICQRYMVNHSGVVEVRYEGYDEFSELEDKLYAVVVPLSVLPLPSEYTTQPMGMGTIVSHFLWDGQSISPFLPREEWTIGVGSTIVFKAV